MAKNSVTEICQQLSVAPISVLCGSVDVALLHSRHLQR